MKPRRESAEFIDTFSALKKCFSAVAMQRYAREELGTTQVRFLRHLGKQTGVSQADLARATNTDPALTGRALQTLIDRGWIQRQRSQDDRRQYLLELTTSGRQTLKRAEKIRAGLAAEVAAALNDRDLDDFERIAKKLLATFASLTASIASR